MAINFAVQQIRNPKDDTGKYFSNRAQKSGDYDFKELAEDIAHATTCTKGDALAVLTSIVPFIKKALLTGKSVHLDELGSFIVSIQSKCFPESSLTDADFKPSESIKGWKIVYRPDATLKKEIRDSIAFKRVSSEWMK